MPKKSIKVKPKPKRIEFSFYSPDASEVFLAGDFNGWYTKKHPMKKYQNGIWQKIVMLYPGKYEYKFLVDEKWEQDPNNDWKCRNCFGTHNNIISVLPKTE